MLSGLIKKLVLAAYLQTHLVGDAFQSPAQQAWPALVLALFAYTAEIYLDFSGYTDLARGLSLLLGIELPENFRHPYAARDIGEFWRRWHMTFSRFLRDYVYFPLGGSRRGRARVYLNLMVTMLVCGLWHGASWGFVIWGLLHGLALVGPQGLAGRARQGCRGRGGRAPAGRGPLLGCLATITFCAVVRVFFRSEDLDGALAYLAALAHPSADLRGFDRGRRRHHAALLRPQRPRGPSVRGHRAALPPAAAPGGAPLLDRHRHRDPGPAHPRNDPLHLLRILIMSSLPFSSSATPTLPPRPQLSSATVTTTRRGPSILSALITGWALALVLSLYGADEIALSLRTSWAGEDPRALALASALTAAAQATHLSALHDALEGPPKLPSSPASPSPSPSPSLSPSPSPSPSPPPTPSPSPSTPPTPRRILLIGASSIQFHLGTELERLLSSYPDLTVLRLGKLSTGLTRPDVFDWPAKLRELCASFHPDLVIANFGGNDAQSMVLPDGRIARFGQPEWEQTYVARLRDIVGIGRQASARVVLLGMSTTRDPVLSRRMGRVNELTQEAARAAGADYLSIWDLGADARGQYQEVATVGGPSYQDPPRRRQALLPYRRRSRRRADRPPPGRDPSPAGAARWSPHRGGPPGRPPGRRRRAAPRQSSLNVAEASPPFAYHEIVAATLNPPTAHRPLAAALSRVGRGLHRCGGGRAAGGGRLRARADPPCALGSPAFCRRRSAKTCASCTPACASAWCPPSACGRPVAASRPSPARPGCRCPSAGARWRRWPICRRRARLRSATSRPSRRPTPGCPGRWA